MPDGSVFASEHDLSLQMEGLDKPKRKRGRPPKGSMEEEIKVYSVNYFIREITTLILKQLLYIFYLKLLRRKKKSTLRI